MRVTEIALLKLLETKSDTLSDGIIPAIAYDGLRKAMCEQAAYSGYPVALLQCMTDFSKIFLVGGWDSVSHHMDDWIPGPINQNLLQILSAHVEVEWMFHLDVDPSNVLGAVRRGEDETVRTSVGIIVVDETQKLKCEVILQESAIGTETGQAVRAVHAWRVDLGYVAESAQPERREVVNTLVVFAIGADEQVIVPGKLHQQVRNEEIYSTKMVARVEKNEETGEWSESAR